MATVYLRVTPIFCGPASVGTVELIKVIRARFGMSLVEAKVIVDRCVFAGEEVSIAASAEEAEAFSHEVSGLESPAIFRVRVES